VYHLPPPDGNAADSSLLEIVPLGLYLIRGDNVAIVSDLREDVFESQEKSGFKGFENAEVLDSVVQFMS